LRKVFVTQEKGDHWAIRKPMHKDTVAGAVILRFKKQVQLTTAIDQVEMVVDIPLKRQIKDLLRQGYDKKAILKYFKATKNTFQDRDISRVEMYFFDLENVASRASIDESFNSSAIGNITDTGIQKILLNHLCKYNENTADNSIEHPELAFSPDGLDDLNKSLSFLNEGKEHKPIIKVRCFEPRGNKFSVGGTGNKKSKFVEAAKGTNLFFAIYQDPEGKRSYGSIPLNIVIERLKQGLFAVPEIKDDGSTLLFYLSPNDLVTLTTTFENKDVAAVYKFVSCTENEGHFVPNTYSSPIIKNELGSNNKSQNSTNGIQIKAVCIKLSVNRLGMKSSVFK